MRYIPDNKVHGANTGPIWGRQDPGGPHVGPMNFAIWYGILSEQSNYMLIQETYGILSEQSNYVLIHEIYGFLSDGIMTPHLSVTGQDCWSTHLQNIRNKS